MSAPVDVLAVIVRHALTLTCLDRGGTDWKAQSAYCVLGPSAYSYCARRAGTPLEAVACCLAAAAGIEHKVSEYTPAELLVYADRLLQAKAVTCD